MQLQVSPLMQPVVRPPERIVALVVTHNRLGQLRRTVSRLLEETVDHLLVIDNGSSDGTSAWLAAQADPRLTIITSAQNSGGAGGFEVGMREATARFDPDWLVLMDDDARPDPGMIAAFRAKDHGTADAVAAAVYYPDGRICEMNRPSVNPFWSRGSFLRTIRRGRMGFHVPDAAYQGRQIAIDGASFVGLFMSRAGVARAGFPDGQLFLYGDDVMYTLGLRRAGGNIRFAPDLRFEHDCGTFDGDIRVARPLWKAYYLHRNALLVYRRAAGPWFPMVLAAVLPKWWAKGRAYGPDRRAFRALLRLALRDALTGRRNRTHAEILARSEALLARFAVSKA